MDSIGGLGQNSTGTMNKNCTAVSYFHIDTLLII